MENEKVIETKVCTHCAASFDITDKNYWWSDKWNWLMYKFHVKQPVWFIIGCLILFIFLYFIIIRIQLIIVSEHAVWQITRITWYNTNCWWGRTSSPFPCTKYNAYVDFTTLKWEKSSLTIWAWNVWWWDEPITNSTKQVWWFIKIIYNPKNISKAYESTFYWIWWAPIIAFFLQYFAFVVALLEPKKIL